MLRGIVLLGMSIILSSAKICPDQKQTGVPRFTKELGNEDMVRYGRSIAISCCAEGYDQIKWYRKQASHWVIYPWTKRSSSITPTVEENQQILRIYQAEISDSTLFRCDLMKNGTVVKKHQMKLIVQRCDERASGPIPTSPAPQNQTISNYGENVTLYCTGYFGCGNNPEEGLVDWMVLGKLSNKSVTTRRYVKHKYSRNQKTILGESLTIHNVQAEDLDRTFTCHLFSSQINNGNHKTDVKIFKKELPAPHPSTLFVSLVSVGGVVGLLLVVILSSCVVKHYYGPRVTLYVKSRLPRCTPAPERGEKILNVLLYHADDDTGKADEIKKQLIQKGYDINMSDDIDGNKSLRVYDEMVKQSMTVMFLYSENLREDNFAHFLLQCLINQSRARDVIFLVMDDYIPENIMASTVAAIDPDLETSLETDGERAETELSPTRNNDLSFWKALPRYNVPSETASKRQKLNFISWLQNKIPKFQDQLVSKRRERPNRRTSSGRGLLDSQGQAELGVSPPNSGTFVGPDEVFILPPQNNSGQTPLGDESNPSRDDVYVEQNEVGEGYQAGNGNTNIPRYDDYDSTRNEICDSRIEPTRLNPIEPTLLNPIEQTPLNPIGQTPLNPFGQTPLNPIGQTPLNPIEQTPLNPIGQTPLNPIGQTPLNPFGQTTLNPIEQTYLFDPMDEVFHNSPELVAEHSNDNDNKDSMLSEQHKSSDFDSSLSGSWNNNHRTGTPSQAIDINGVPGKNYMQNSKTDMANATGRSERSKLSERQSSGESGYGTTFSDRGLSV